MERDSKIQTRLREEVKFTYNKQPSKRPKPPMREIIRMALYELSPLTLEEIEHMRNNPEDREWLKTHVRPKMWKAFVAAANETGPVGAPQILE